MNLTELFIRRPVMTVLLNVALTLAVPNIAWQAHLGGALAGLAMGALYQPRRR